MTEEAHAKIIISALSALKAFDPPAELFLKYYRFAEPVTIPESNKSSWAISLKSADQALLLELA